MSMYTKKKLFMLCLEKKFGRLFCTNLIVKCFKFSALSDNIRSTFMLFCESFFEN